MHNDEILTVQEAAEMLKLSSRTVYNLVHVDGFPAVRIGKSLRIPRDLLMRWVRQQAEGATPFE